VDTYSDEIDLREYIEVLWRWKGFIVGITLLAVLAAGVVSFFVLEPVYEASVQVMVPQSPLPTEIIRSPHFMQSIVEKAGLGEQYDAFSLARDVSVETSKSSATLTTIRVQSTDPRLATTLANQIALDFLDFVKAKYIESLSDSTMYLTSEKAAAEAELAALREKLSSLKEESRIEALQIEVDRLAELVASYRSRQSADELRRQELLKGIEELTAALASTPPTLPGPPDWAGNATEVPNDTYQNLSETLAYRKVELAEVTTRLAQAESTLPSLKREYDAQYASLLSYQYQIRELEAQISVLEEEILSYTARINELTTSLPQTNLVSPAVEPTEPIKPHKLMNVVVAAVLGGFVSVLAVFAIEYWRSPRRPATISQ
jgi:succinoglycan biosynthesis transport protein ExoP